MPLPKRVISPVYVSRDTLPEHLQLSNDLEGVTNGTLSNIIRQLSSLSHHAEDIFGELYKEAETLHNRSSNLQARIDRLAVKVTQLDSTVEEVSLQDIHLRKAFRSSVVFDQQVVSKQTIPTAMADTYHHCDKPPPLDKLNVYRSVLDRTATVVLVFYFIFRVWWHDFFACRGQWCVCRHLCTQ